MAVELPKFAEPIKNWHFVIGGFLQHEGKPTGAVRLFRNIHSQVAEPATRVELRSWNDNFAHAAEFVARSTLRKNYRITISGFSWGGAGAIKLASELQDRGFGVKWLVLCDAVYRHWYPLGSWRAFVPWIELAVPENVEYVKWCYQRENWPRGHTVVAENESLTRVWPGVLLNYTHEEMDESQWWQHTAYEVALG